MKPVCYFLIGLPASGKSSYIENVMLAEHHNYFPHTKPVILSTDNYIEAKCKLAGETYSEGFSKYYAEAERNMYDELQYAIIDKRDIIWDQTNLNVNARRKKLALLKDYEIHAVVVPLPEEDEWLRRLSSRPGKVIPVHALLGMKKNYQHPTKEEGFDFIMVAL